MALVESFSGIRGIYDKDLTDAIAVRYAYSYCSFLKNKTKKNSKASPICFPLNGIFLCFIANATPSTKTPAKEWKNTKGCINISTARSKDMIYK